MTALFRILPQESETTVEAVAQTALAARSTLLGVASPEAQAFAAELSHRLLNSPQARTFPSLQALGFWLRASSIKNMIRHHLAAPPGTYRAPRGIVFQIPPGNVDVLFGYTALLSILGGNITILRLPGTLRPEQEALVTVIRETMAVAPDVIRERLILVRYGHDETISASFSALCDARLVWGGDETVQTIRRIPLPPLAHEMSFADRFSAMALSASAYNALSSGQRDQVAQTFYNDLYQFDQMTCASPRLVIWAGDKNAARRARADFYPRLAAYAMERYGEPGIGESVAKTNTQFLGLHDLCVETSTTYNPTLTVLELNGWEGLSAFKNNPWGYGLLLDTQLDNLRDLATYAERRDQTLTVWGFDPDEIHAFVMQCGGRGFDRIVPMGQALSFDPIWDGNNLFDVLTRLVQVMA